MGYIAPVTNYQYTQYAERVISKRYDPYRFVPIDRIKHLANRQDFNHPFLFKDPNPHQESKVSKKMYKEQPTDKIYSEITGKGRYFSEYA
ncbi:hypothetical protein J2Z40_001767 [Cytobacillus eiseniae]|uniref:Uncharacterized protein n=1 Tax=Cytobacillus eiseniae TaxID=762947 RepID=A0ABS4RE75_9BACI|nr:hypothetical protein [Cytobacillus eiseniae]MBP2241205.1 hypothetical protein [Cytobacillus eiseniae]